MSDAPAKRSPTEPSKRGYSQDELEQIYELAKACLEIGQVRRAEILFSGLNEVAQDFGPAWLGSCYIQILHSNYDLATTAAQQALRSDPESTEAMVYLAAVFLTTGDFNSAGTYLGEVGERIEMGKVQNPHTIRAYKMQLARYQSR